MYRVTVITDGEEYVLHDPRITQVQLLNPTLDLEMGKTGSFSFSVPAEHPHRDKIYPLSSEIIVYDDSDIIFSGRSLTSEEDFYLTGKISCEGAMAYLLDSVQRPYEFKGSIIEFFERCLNEHNAQVEERKQFVIGNVTVIDNNNYINRSNSDDSNTMEALSEKLVDTHGGYLRVRYADGKKYLDYVTDYGGTNSQPIRFGENLIDLKKTVDPTSIITALIPRGASLDDGSVVDIKSVNNGQDYIIDEDARAKYGLIWGVQKWEDVTEPKNLLTKSLAYLKECVVLPATIELSALDLSLVDVSIERLKVGYWTVFESAPHKISTTLMLSKMHLPLTNPAGGYVVLGQTLPTFTGSSNKQMKAVTSKVDQVAAGMNKEIMNATQTILGGKGGYFVVKLGEDGHPEETLYMDAPDESLAVNILRINKNGIGFSTSGSAGPYTNAWTIDGRLLATFIFGGILTLGGIGNQNGIFRILDGEGKQIGHWDSSGISLTSGKTEDSSIRTYDPSLVQISPSDASAIVIIGGSKGKISGAVYKCSTSIGYEEIEMDYSVNDPVDGTFKDKAVYSGSGVEFTSEFDGEEYTAYMNASDFSAVTGYFESSLSVDGNLDVLGEKNRIVQTRGYGNIRLAAYETAEPIFGDIGTGTVGEDGRCFIFHDCVLMETVNTECEYQVFLQKYGTGDVWVSERTPTFFVVSGTPGLEFGWEMKAKQKGYELVRLDERLERIKKEKTNYAAEGAAYVESCMEELIL